MEPTATNNGNFIPGASGYRVDDLVCISKKKRGDAGYDWYQYDHNGIVTICDGDRLSIKLADGSVEEYSTAKAAKDADFVYTITDGSETEYLKENREKADEKRSTARQYAKEASEIDAWRAEYLNSVSMSGRLRRFLQSFRN